MPIDFYSTAKKTSQWAFGSPFLNKILSSSAFVAGIVSFLMIILIMIMYPAKSGTSFSIVIKMFVYMFFGSLLFIFLHDGVVRYMTEEAHNEQQSVAFMQNITQTGRTADPSYATMYKPIVPAAQASQQSTPQAVVQIPIQPITPASTQSSTTGAAEVSGNESSLPTTFVVSAEPVLGGAPAKWKPRPASQNPYK